MSAEDLSSWLKVAAENKITTKNTWKSTLIEHFNNITHFKDKQGINFLRASSTLDGCIKVYSTRVDDVSEEATKLLEGFSFENVLKKKQNKKKGIKTLETNFNNLDIKQNKLKVFSDPTFLFIDKKTDTLLLLDTLQVSSDGIYRIYKENNLDYEIKMNKPDLQHFEVEDKFICPTLTKYKDLKIINEEEEDKFEPVEFEEISFEIDEPVQSPIFKSDTFSYFKNWQGPTVWKAKLNKKEKKLRNKKVIKQFKIDFTEQISVDLINEKGDTLLDPISIEKRREIKYTLPEDYRLEISDLYKYNVIDKDIIESNYEYQELSVVHEPNIVMEPLDEIVEVHQEKEVYLPFRRIQKKVDIKKLKNNILHKIGKRKSSKLSDIYKDIPLMYENKEREDISIHYCIVSLLHVANEKNLDLEIQNNDVVIRTCSNLN